MSIGKGAFHSQSCHKIKSILYVSFILLVMVVMATVPYLTYYDDTNSTSLRNSQKFDMMRLEGESKTFGKDRTNGQTRQDDRSMLNIKVLFIGVKKCGTTTLKAFAKQHPDIIVENMPHVCRPRPYKSYKPIADKLEEAESQGKVAIIENSECLHNYRYFNLLKRPEKLILLLCDPTLRTYSDYKHIVRTFDFKQPFEQIVSNAVSLIEAHKNDKNFAEFLSQLRYQRHLDYSIVSVGFYYEYLKDIYKLYNPKNILILSGAEFKQIPHTVMYKLESFLGVRHYLKGSDFVKNPETGFYCLKRRNKGPLCIGVRHKPFPPPDETTLKKLQTLYHPYNEKLYHLINRTFMWI